MHQRLKGYVLHIVAMLLFVKNLHIVVNGLYFMMIKFSSNLYQYQGAKGANRL